jgi:hypothetical protein
VAENLNLTTLAPIQPEIEAREPAGK